MDTFEKLQKLISERLGVNEEDVTKEASFKDDLGADSLDVVELVMELEDTFEVEVPDEKAEEMQKVGDVLAFLEQG